MRLMTHPRYASRAQYLLARTSHARTLRALGPRRAARRFGVACSAHGVRTAVRSRAPVQRGHGARDGAARRPVESGGARCRCHQAPAADAGGRLRRSGAAVPGQRHRRQGAVARRHAGRRRVLAVGRPGRSRDGASCLPDTADHLPGQHADAPVAGARQASRRRASGRAGVGPCAGGAACRASPTGRSPTGPSPIGPGPVWPDHSIPRPARRQRRCLRRCLRRRRRRRS